MLADIDDNARIAAAQLLMWVGIAFFLIWCISFAIRSANKRERRELLPPLPAPTRHQGAAFPVIVDEGPGKFVVTGVDKETAMDVTEYVNAASPANARVKAELKGVVVTKVERA